MIRLRQWAKRAWDWIFDGRPADLQGVYKSAAIAKASAEASGSASDQLMESGLRISRMANDLRRYQAVARKK